MDNIMNMDIGIMYNEIKDMTDAKSVLEKLQTLKTQMDWMRYTPLTDMEIRNIRYLTYGVWLKEHKEDWYDYFIESTKALQVLGLGHCPTHIPKPPEGWIPPMDYIKGKIKSDKSV